MYNIKDYRKNNKFFKQNNLMKLKFLEKYSFKKIKLLLKLKFTISLYIMTHKINLQRKLFSTNEKEVIEVLKNISEIGYPEIITDLIGLYSSSQFENVKNQIYFILSNLKDKNSVSYFIHGLKLETNPEIRTQLISACWQNGLDYSDYLEYFIEIISKESMFNSIEAFSVIEGNYTNLEESKLIELRSFVKKIKKETVEENLKLLSEVESIIS